MLPEGSCNNVDRWASYLGIAGFVTDSSGTTFYINPYDPSWNYYHEVKSTMQHEAYHHYSGHNQYGTPEGQQYLNEIDAIMSQVTGWDYLHTTFQFKQGLADSLLRFWTAAGFTGIGYDLGDAQRICKC